MKAGITTRGAEGLAARLAIRVLAPAAARVAGEAAADLSGRIETATGAAPETAGTPARPLVRVTDPEVLARVRGDAEREGDPVLDRVRLDFARRAGARAEEMP